MEEVLNPPPTLINGVTDPDLVNILHHMGADLLASNYAVQINSVCEHHKNSVSDNELSSFIFDLQKSLNSK